MNTFSETIKAAIYAGGATWDADMRPIRFKDGYMISLPGYETRHGKDDIAGIVDAVERLRRSYRLNLQPAITYIGLWTDGGEVFIDLSFRETRRESAITAGKAYKQKAIFDLKAGESIRL